MDNSLLNTQPASNKRKQLLLHNVQQVEKIVNDTIKSGVLLNSKPSTVDKLMHNCKLYDKERDMTQTVVLSSWTKYNVYSKSDVTLTTQLSLNRYRLLDLMISYWEGPVSATLFVGPKDLPMMSDFLETANKWVTYRDNVDLHFVPKQTVSMAIRITLCKVAY